MGRPPCRISICCSEIRAIAVYEALSAFDRIYILTLVPTTPEGPCALTTELIRTLRVIFEVVTPSFSVHPSVKLLISLSYIISAIHDFFQIRDPIYWIGKVDLYTIIFNFLRLLVDCQLSELLSKPLYIVEPHIFGGLGRWMENDPFALIWRRYPNRRARDAQTHPSLYDVIEGLNRNVLVLLNDVASRDIANRDCDLARNLLSDYDLLSFHRTTQTDQQQPAGRT